jgi:hypothetical protein
MLSNDKAAEADAVGTGAASVVVEGEDEVADLALLDKPAVLNLPVVHWVLRSEPNLLILLHWDWMYGLRALKAFNRACKKLSFMFLENKDHLVA